MEKPYQELAWMVGKVLAERWLSGTAKPNEPTETQAKSQSARRRKEPADSVVQTEISARRSPPPKS